MAQGYRGFVDFLVRIGTDPVELALLNQLSSLRDVLEGNEALEQVSDVFLGNTLNTR
jgi:hypothetical protein